MTIQQKAAADDAAVNLAADAVEVDDAPGESYIYIYIYIYVCMYVYIYIYTHMYIL